jgi:hypothetical protein
MGNQGPAAKNPLMVLLAKNWGRLSKGERLRILEQAQAIRDGQ